MNKINQSVIETLATPQTGSVLTIYAPTHRISTPPTIQEDQTRLKNLVRTGFEQWQKTADGQNVKQVHKQLEDILSREDFWTDTTESLAIFANEKGVWIYNLPIECQEYTHVDGSFDLTPLHICKELDQPYYVFALAMHHAKLFRGDMYGLEPVEIDFPSSPEDALNIDEMFSGSNTIRGVSTQGGGNDKLSSHGQGDSNHAGQEERLKYFRILDNTIIKSKQIEARLPVVIAATESEASDYKNISNLPNLIHAYVPGNHTMTPLQELHGLTWDILKQEVIDKNQQSLVRRFNEQKGIQKASSDVGEVSEAAGVGRVDTLVLGVMPTTNDSIADTSNTNAPLIRLDEAYRTGPIRQLVIDVIEQGGNIVGIDPERLATPSNVGAIYRY